MKNKERVSSIFDLQKKYYSGELEKSDFINKMFSHHKFLYDYRSLLGVGDIKTITLTRDDIHVETEAGVRLVVDPSDSRSCPIEAFNFGVFERSDRSSIMKIASVSKVIFDVGANLGWYSLLLAKTYPAAEVYAFEPLPRTYSMLQKNMSLNLLSNLKSFNLAVFNNKDNIDLYWSELESGSTSIANLREYADATMIKVPAITLDEFCSQKNIYPDFIKLDIEGSELFALEGAKEVLTIKRPTIFCELLRKWAVKCGYEVNEVLAYLHKYRYVGYVFKKGIFEKIEEITEETTFTNFYFFPIEKSQEMMALDFQISMEN
jgi:FkbM family methyltransferase